MKQMNNLLQSETSIGEIKKKTDMILFLLEPISDAKGMIGTFQSKNKTKTLFFFKYLSKKIFLVKYRRIIGNEHHLSLLN